MTAAGLLRERTGRGAAMGRRALSPTALGVRGTGRVRLCENQRGGSVTSGWTPASGHSRTGVESCPVGVFGRGGEADEQACGAPSGVHVEFGETSQGESVPGANGQDLVFRWPVGRDGEEAVQAGGDAVGGQFRRRRSRWVLRQSAQTSRVTAAVEAASVIRTRSEGRRGSAHLPSRLQPHAWQLQRVQPLEAGGDAL